MEGKVSKHAGSRFWVERAVSLKCPVFYHDFMGKWGKNGVREQGVGYGSFRSGFLQWMLCKIRELVYLGRERAGVICGNLFKRGKQRILGSSPV